MIEYVTFTCLYDVEFVPKGARIPRRRYFRKEGLKIPLNRIASSEASVTFRIREPSEFADEPDDIAAILSWADQLWWPLQWRKNRSHHVSEQQLLAAFIDCREDVLGQQEWRPNEWQPAKDILEKTPVRELIEDGFEPAFAAAQKKAASQLLICDGMAYVAGGEPLYFIDGFGRYAVGPVGPDRTAEPHCDWARSSVLETIDKYVYLSDMQRAIFRGNIFPFQTTPEMMRGSLSNDAQQQDLPTIECLIPPTRKISLIELQLDSLYRRLVRELKYAGTRMMISPLGTILDPIQLQFRDILLRSCRKSCDDPELSRTRFDLLAEALNSGVGSEQLLHGIERHINRPDLGDDMKTPLDPGDDAALGSLA